MADLEHVVVLVKLVKKANKDLLVCLVFLEDVAQLELLEKGVTEETLGLMAMKVNKDVPVIQDLEDLLAIKGRTATRVARGKMEIQVNLLYVETTVKRGQEDPLVLLAALELLDLLESLETRAPKEHVEQLVIEDGTESLVLEESKELWADLDCKETTEK